MHDPSRLTRAGLGCPAAEVESVRWTRDDPMITVRPVEPQDAGSWLRLRAALWPDSTEAEHEEEIARFFSGEALEPAIALLSVNSSGDVVGLAELSLRPCAEGCRSSPVAYLEGWFVVPEARRRGVGRALVSAAEAWARAQGCSELASDTQPDNRISAAAHRAIGFSEAGLVLCFRKEL